MLEVVEDNGLIWIKASETLESLDYDRFIPLFERIAARESGPVSMVIELAPDFSGWDLGGLWRDLKFDMKHKDKFGRIAIVGNKTWEEWGTKLSDPFFPSAEIRFFEPAEISKAEAWAQAGQGRVNT